MTRVEGEWKVGLLDETVDAEVLEGSRNALALGRRCALVGHGCYWKPGTQSPSLLGPDTCVVDCEVHDISSFRHVISRVLCATQKIMPLLCVGDERFSESEVVQADIFRASFHVDDTLPHRDCAFDRLYERRENGPR